MPAYQRPYIGQRFKHVNWFQLYFRVGCILFGVAGFGELLCYFTSAGCVRFRYSDFRKQHLRGGRSSKIICLIIDNYRVVNSESPNAGMHSELFENAGFRELRQLAER